MRKVKIGWVGAGLMGGPMVARLLDAGYDIALYTRSGLLPESLAEARSGLEVVASLGELARRSDAVFTILGGPQDVLDVYLSPGGLIPHMQTGAVLVDLTTSSVEVAERVAAAAAERGGWALDAPVSGGPFGAESGTLSIMVGGQARALESVREVLAILGNAIVHHGGTGTGQCAKLVNQLVVASVTEACAEAFLLGRQAGLDIGKVAESLAAGAAGSPLSRFVLDRLDRGDQSPGFKIAHLRKDLELVLAEGTRLGVPLPLAVLTRDATQEVERRLGGEVGTQMLGFRLGSGIAAPVAETSGRGLA